MSLRAWFSDLWAHIKTPAYSHADQLVEVNKMVARVPIVVLPTQHGGSVRFIDPSTGEEVPSPPSPVVNQQLTTAPNPTPPVIPESSPQEESTIMAITYKSVGHFFAVAFTALKTDLPKVEATAPTVEAVTAVAAGPVYGPQALTNEKAGYAALGELSAVLNAGGAAAAAKLADAGLDTNVIQTVQSLVAGVGNVATVAKAI